MMRRDTGDVSTVAGTFS